MKVLAKMSAVIHSTYIAFLFSLTLTITMPQVSVGPADENVSAPQIPFEASRVGIQPYIFQKI